VYEEVDDVETASEGTTGGGGIATTRVRGFHLYTKKKIIVRGERKRNG